MRAYEILNENKATHLTKLGRFHKGADPLAQYVSQRATHKFALHPDAWEDTFYSLTLKDPRKIRYYGPKEIEIVPGTLVGDMALANKFYRAKSDEDKEVYAQAYKDSLKPYPQNLNQYKLPELLVPQTEELTEKVSRGRPVVMVDVQPAYTPIETQYEYLGRVAQFLAQHRGPVLAYVNADETGLTDDNIMDDIFPMWDEVFMDQGLDRDQKIAAMEDITWMDKGYGYLRGWMDIGIEPKYIIATIREMYRQKVSDSRSLFGGDEDKLFDYMHPISKSIGCGPYDIIEEPLSVGWVAVDQLKRYNNCYLIGGARDQCLKEVAILMNAFNIKYTMVDNLIYD